MTDARTTKVMTEVAYTAEPEARATKIIVEVAYVEGTPPPEDAPKFHAQVIG